MRIRCVCVRISVAFFFSFFWGGEGGGEEMAGDGGQNMLGYLSFFGAPRPFFA